MARNSNSNNPTALGTGLPLKRRRIKTKPKVAAINHTQSLNGTVIGGEKRTITPPINKRL